MPDEVTEDRLLGGRVRLRQPVTGFRASIDPVLLAAAVPAQDGDLVLDVGAGTGAAALCLASRVSEAVVTGIEADRTLVRLATDNADATGVGARVRFYLGDVGNPPIRLSPASFGHVMVNPPFAPQGSGRTPRDPGRAQAMVEGGVPLAGWLEFCMRMVKSGGTVTVIQRADRLAEVLQCLCQRLGGLTVAPLWPGAGKPAKRVIIAGIKGSAAPLMLAPGLTLHQPDGSYTREAEVILRGCGPFDLRSSRSAA